MRKNWMFIGLWVAFLLLFTGFVTNIPYDYDFFTYLSNGKLFFEKGLSLLYDQHTVVFYGKKIVPNPWIFSFLVGAANQIGGLIGLKVLQQLLYLIPLFIIFWFSIKEKKRNFVFSAAISLLALCVFASRITFRPELMGYTYVLITLLIFERYQSTGSKLGFWYLPILMVFWSNTHTTVTFGYILLAAFLFSEFVKLWKLGKINWTELRPFVFLGTSCTLAGSITPYPFEFHPLLMAKVSNPNHQVYTQLIAEFTEEFAFRSPLYLLAWALFVVELSKALKNKSLYWFLVLGIFGIYSMWYGKIVPHMIVPTVFSAIANDFPSMQFTKRLRWAIVGLPLIGLVILSPELSFTTNNVRTNSLAENFRAKSSYPVEVSDYLVESARGGNFFVRDYASGYLLSVLPQKIKVAADIRYNQVMPMSYLESLAMALVNPYKLHKHLENWDYNYLVEMIQGPYTLLDVAPYIGNMKALWIGEFSSLYSRNGDGFENATKLIMDAQCIDKISLDSLEKERQLFDQLMAGKAEINFIANLLDVAVAYKKAKTFDEFRALPLRSTTIWTNRLFSYIYLKHKDPKLALMALSTIPYRSTMDYIRTAEILLLAGQRKNAILQLDAVLISLLTVNPYTLDKFAKLYFGLEDVSEDKARFNERKNFVVKSIENQKSSDFDFMRKCAAK